MPPNIAAMISQTVLSILSIPPRESRSSRASLPVLIQICWPLRSKQFATCRFQSEGRLCEQGYKASGRSAEQEEVNAGFLNAASARVTTRGNSSIGDSS